MADSTLSFCQLFLKPMAMAFGLNLPIPELFVVFVEEYD